MTQTHSTYEDSYSHFMTKSKNGQASIPRDGDWRLLSEWGLTILERIGNYYYHCQLPQGWREIDLGQTHSCLIDEKGQRRASIVYTMTISEAWSKIIVWKKPYHVQLDYDTENEIAYVIRDYAHHDNIVDSNFPHAFYAFSNRLNKAGIYFKKSFFCSTINHEGLNVTIREFKGEPVCTLTERSYFETFYNPLTQSRLLTYANKLASQRAHSKALEMNKQFTW